MATTPTRAGARRGSLACVNATGSEVGRAGAVVMLMAGVPSKLSGGGAKRGRTRSSWGGSSGQLPLVAGDDPPGGEVDQERHEEEHQAGRDQHLDLARGALLVVGGD